MKEEALKLADWLEDGEVEKYDIDEAANTIRKLIAILEAYEKLSEASKLASPPPKKKPLSDEEIYALWCEADNTELLPEMRLKDGSINYIITTFAKLIEERHGIEPTERIG